MCCRNRASGLRTTDPRPLPVDRKLLGGDSVAVAELSGGIVEAACSLLLRGLAEALLGRATAQWAEQAHAGSASPQAISAGPDIQL